MFLAHLPCVFVGTAYLAAIHMFVASQRAAPTTQERPVGIKREHRLHNPTRHAEVEDNIAAVPLQVDEITGRLFNEPLTPVRSDSVRAAQFLFATAG